STASRPVIASRGGTASTSRPNRPASFSALLRDRPPIATSCPARTQPSPRAAAIVPVPRIPMRICRCPLRRGRLRSHGREGDAHRSVRDRGAMMGGEMTHDAHCYELVADCRLRAATDLFAHMWDPVVLAALRTGPRRRRELRAAIGGISDKVLTDALRRLLANGLIERH